MILQNPSFFFYGIPHWSQISSCRYGQWRNQTNHCLILHHRPPRNARAAASTLNGADFIVGVASNKVLIAAFASGIIGQLVKPFASVFLYGKEFDIRSVTETGGFPSSHSSATVASATLLGLQRGLSDPIFGLTIVYAGLIMYDAQGVRREVGVHAKTLNKLILHMRVNSVLHAKDRDSGLINSQRAGSSSSTPLNEKSVLSQAQEATSLVKASNKTRQIVEGKLSSAYAEEISRLVGDDDDDGLEIVTFKESIGHTEMEVLGGALLGFLVGLTVYKFL